VPPGQFTVVARLISTSRTRASPPAPGYVPRGKVNPKRRSITELEFREAKLAAKPRLIFLLNEDGAWPSRLMDAHTGDGERGPPALPFRPPRSMLAQSSLRNADLTSQPPQR
jgi:hypothetical protein